MSTAGARKALRRPLFLPSDSPHANKENASAEAGPKRAAAAGQQAPALEERVPKVGSPPSLSGPGVDPDCLAPREDDVDELAEMMREDLSLQATLPTGERPASPGRPTSPSPGPAGDSPAVLGRAASPRTDGSGLPPFCTPAEASSPCAVSPAAAHTARALWADGDAGRAAEPAGGSNDGFDPGDLRVDVGDEGEATVPPSAASAVCYPSDGLGRNAPSAERAAMATADPDPRVHILGCAGTDGAPPSPAAASPIAEAAGPSVVPTMIDAESVLVEGWVTKFSDVLCVGRRRWLVVTDRSCLAYARERGYTRGDAPTMRLRLDDSAVLPDKQTTTDLMLLPATAPAKRIRAGAVATGGACRGVGPAMLTPLRPPRAPPAAAGSGQP